MGILDHLCSLTKGINVTALLKQWLCSVDADDPDLFSLIDSAADKPTVSTSINPTKGGNLVPEEGEKMFLVTIDKGDEELLLVITRRRKPVKNVDTGKSP